MKQEPRLRFTKEEQAAPELIKPIQKVKKEELISLLKKSDEKEKKAAKKKEKPVKTEEERAPKKKKRKKRRRKSHLLWCRRNPREARPLSAVREEDSQEEKP